MILPLHALILLVAGALLIVGLAAPLTKRPWLVRVLATVVAIIAGLHGLKDNVGTSPLVVYAVCAFLLVALLLLPGLELQHGQQRPEAAALMLLAGTGALVLATGGDLLQLTIGMETLSLSA
ncbi:MAG TPA: hypothetical protein VKU60_05560, partial [Chloroflexota bacterium]|nr:hypothetical protein [Chloroflexota bacterium]